MDEQNQNQNSGAPVASPAPAPEPQAPAPVAAPKPVAPLPEAAPDRTKEQFEKLLESNRRLYQTNELLRNQLERPSAQAQGQAQKSVVDDFIEVNPLTGEKYIDENRLKSQLGTLQEKAQRLEQQMQSYVSATETRESQRQAREATSVHPELDPNSDKFDLDFNKQVRGILIDAINNPNDYNGRSLTLREAADYVKGQLGKVSQQAQTSVQQQQAEAQQQQLAAEAQARKEQASTQATSQTGNQARASVSDEQELNDLRYRTRFNHDDDALARRIMHTEHILQKDSVRGE